MLQYLQAACLTEVFNIILHVILPAADASGWLNGGCSLCLSHLVVAMAVSRLPGRALPPSSPGAVGPTLTMVPVVCHVTSEHDVTKQVAQVIICHLEIRMFLTMLRDIEV